MVKLGLEFHQGQQHPRELDSLVALNTKTQSHLGPLYHQIDLDLAKLIKDFPRR